MNVGLSSAGYAQFVGVAGSSFSAFSAAQPPSLFQASGDAAQGLLAAQHLQAFFSNVLGIDAMAPQQFQPPLPGVGLPPFGQQMAMGMNFGAAASWSTPAFLPMGPSFAGMGPGASFGAYAGNNITGMGAVGFSAVFAMMSTRNAGSAEMSMAARIEDDPNGVAQSGQGMKSNLANSPEAMLAIQELLKGGGSKTYEDMAKSLKEDFGIEADVGDIKVKDKDGKETTAKGVKFGNGDYFIDGNGNGQLETADYKFGDAVTALKEKYGLKDEDLTRVTDRMKAGAKQRTEGNGYLEKFKQAGSDFPPALTAISGAPPLMYDPQMNIGWMLLFLQAYQLAA